MENYKKRAIQLLTNLAVNETKMPSVIPYAPSKLKTSGKEEKYFKRRPGGVNGAYSKILLAMLSELESEKRSNVHNLMVFKDGEVIADVSAPGYDSSVFHLAQSMSKTVTAIAIGFLYDEGKIDLNEKAIRYFGDVKYTDERIEHLTIKDLLTMKSGVKFAELGVVTEAEWTKAFFAEKLAYAPGERFSYNSMNSYILASIVTSITGESLGDYVNKKLLKPLDIENFLWERGPEGIEKGGFGLYLSCESFLKIGVMLANGGVFGEKRIISEEYLSEMLTRQSEASDGVSGFDYGYHIWVSPDEEEFLLNGMLGQNVWISKRSGFVVSLNCGNNELFSDSPTLAIIRKHLGRISGEIYSTRAEFRSFKKACESFFKSRMTVTALEEKRGLACLLRLKPRRPFDESWNGVTGQYAFRDNNAGILPLFVRIMQNNFQGGIDKISLERSSDYLYLTSSEGGAEHRIAVGLYEFEESTVEFSGEKYIVKALAETTEDEDKNKLYKILLCFPELPSSRLIKIAHTHEGILVKMSEMPNQKIAESYLESISKNGKLAFMISLLEKKMGEGYLKKKIYSVFNPELNAINTKNSGWEQTILNDNLKLAQERETSSKFIKSLINKFVLGKSDEQPKTEKTSFGGFIAKALSAIIQMARHEINDEENDKEENKTVVDISDDVIVFFNDEEQQS